MMRPHDVGLTGGVDSDGKLRLADEAVDEHRAHDRGRTGLNVHAREEEAHEDLTAVTRAVGVGSVLAGRSDLAERNAALHVAAGVVGARRERRNVQRSADRGVGAVGGPQPIPTVLAEGLSLQAEVHVSSVLVVTCRGARGRVPRRS